MKSNFLDLVEIWMTIFILQFFDNLINTFTAKMQNQKLFQNVKLLKKTCS